MKCPNCGSGKICAQAIVDWHVSGPTHDDGYWVFTGHVDGNVSCCDCGFNSDDVSEFEGAGAPRFEETE